MSSVRPTNQPEPATEVVGALSLADLGPLARRPLSMVFVLAAIAVALGRAAFIASDLGTGGPLNVAIYGALSAATQAVVVLLPAALLARVPSAPRTHRTLLAGLALGALVEVVRVSASLISTRFSDPSIGSGLGTLAWLVLPVASLLVGLGLLQLRAGRIARRGMLVVIAGIYLGLSLVPLGADLVGNAPILFTSIVPVSAILVPLAAAFAGWVAFDAWLAGDRPTQFWRLLAVGVPLYVAGALLGEMLPAFLAVPADPATINDIAFTSLALGQVCSFGAAGLALIAYARLIPIAVDPLEAVDVRPH